MFLSKIFSFSTKNEEIIYENIAYKMIKTCRDDKIVTKFVYKRSIKQYVLLNNIHHDNLIKPTKINTKSNIFYTQLLFPFNKVYKSGTKEFNKHIFYCLANAIDFLHKKCNILHNNIDIESLFFTEDGKIVLGGFENSKTTSYHDPDNIQFSNLVQKFLKVSTNIESFINENKTSSQYFIDNDIFFFGFDSHNVEHKIEFIRSVKDKHNEFVEIYKKKIIRIFVKDLSKDYDKFYKEEILNMIFSLDVDCYEDVLPSLFYVLDSNVRLFLFRNCKVYTKKIESLDKCLDSLLLGLKIKKNDLRKETINFLKRNFNKFTDLSIVKILEYMFVNISEPEDILLILNYVNSTKPRLSNTDIIYNMCKKYVTITGCKNETLKTIHLFYTSFNKHKVSVELLPLLCTYLADSKVQNSTFLLVEDILADLKCHKEKILSKEWSFTDLFGNNKTLKSKSAENINEKEQQNSDEEWDDDW
ncbi:hypothetical protein NCER_100756 [Vairimorpha ceranae BRL01]|uniref:Protein kinase domain-containing protein n=2 Tax=Vairimorpha ceranae TaxID=40302 RepID=C4V8E2_VAIC1|nr:gtpase sar1 related small g protein [Vairimorpha ceranae]EEQ82503.1 hypothetical protein NCER_100756 [Vairimorpha ceranae BRL01]KAF5140477.1 hypothetical protein G9O61_00g012820 [Vairimorpha ceranae]KKO74392.1 gtpase sar1 related small g protein [Vairimorpha ceranae]